jgi:drug/metabolite transporter (DMT)-like permease
MFLRRAPAVTAAGGALLAFAGLHILTGGAPSQWNRGDVLVFICAFWFSIHILLTGRYALRFDPLALATWQLGMTALLGILLSLWSGSLSLDLTTYAWGVVLFTAIFCTVFAYGVQTYVQQFTSPTRTALIFTAEPVFGALFAHFYGGEPLMRHHMIGGGLIFLGMVLAELRPKGWHLTSRTGLT